MFHSKSIAAFVCLAESKTFAEAADKLHITQPALSTSIKKLEEQLGGKLFSRNTRNVSLSIEGKAFLPQAKRLLIDWSNAQADMQSLFAVKRGTLTIAAMPSYAEGLLPLSVKAFTEKHPNIRYRILDVVMEQVIDCVLSGRAELGFSFAPDELDGLEFFPLFDDAFIAIMSDVHPLSKGGSCRWEDVLTQPFVAMNRDSTVRQWLERTSETLKVPMNLVAEANQLSTVGQLVMAGLGVSIVPSLCRDQMLAKGLCCKPLSQHHLVKPVGILRATRRGLSVAAQKYWDFVTQ